MKSANLMFSTALASLILLAPATATHAAAAGIKIKPQIVKVKPKVAVAKPKVKVRIRAARAKVRVKPKLSIMTAKPRIKPRAQKPKIVLTRKIGPKLTQAVRIKPAVKPRVSPQIAAAKISTRAVMVTPRARPSRRKTPEATGLRNTRINAAAMDQQRGIRDALNGARELGNMKDALTLGKLRVAAAPSFGLATPDLTTAAPMRNQDRIGAVPGTGKRPGMFQDDLGAGPDGFTGLGNSHARDTPSNPWAVTDESISSAMGGVAGDRVRLPISKIRRSQVTMDTGWLPADTGYETRATVKVHQDGREVWGNFRRVDTFVPSEPPAAEEAVEPVVPVEVGAAELRNPDHVQGGYSGCRDIGCIVRGGGKPKGLQYADVKDGKSQVFPGPDNAQPNGSNGTAPIYTANDVLERYDPDSTRASGGQPVKMEDLCMHSEC